MSWFLIISLVLIIIVSLFILAKIGESSDEEISLSEKIKSSLKKIGDCCKHKGGGA